MLEHTEDTQITIITKILCESLSDWVWSTVDNKHKHIHMKKVKRQPNITHLYVLYKHI